MRYNKKDGAKMESERKQKLIKYLYPNEKIRSFLCDNIYLELCNILPKQIFISQKNIVSATRKENLNNAKSVINSYIENNIEIKKSLFSLFKNNNLEIIIGDIVIGYVFYLTNSVPRMNGIDIFRDKRSVCYSPISIIDIIC